MGKYTGITSECAVPAVSADYVPMSKRPPITAQVVIGTPGTIKKWMSSRKLGVSCLKILVFDEADHMLSEVSTIYSLLAKLFCINFCMFRYFLHNIEASHAHIWSSVMTTFL